MMVLCKQTVYQCPYCRGEAEMLSELFVCSDCRAFYHRECWIENKGCAVYGCTGIKFEKKRGRIIITAGEPKWLTALRIIVFAFIPTSLACISLKSLPGIELFFYIWTLIFLFTAPMLFIVEIVGLFKVIWHPELYFRYGDRAYHVLSLFGYFAIVLVLLINV
jgi:hypothetical protein